MKDGWDAIEEVFHAARELRGEARSKFLDNACGSDDAMRRQVEVLLERDEKTTVFLDQSAAAMVSVTLAPGTAVGPYEIIDIAGIGGMGQVYRARDPRLKRTVAIKMLPAFARDSKRIAEMYPRKSEVVEMRFFGGLSADETAEVLRVSSMTVKRDWSFARAWLEAVLSGEIPLKAPLSN